VPLRFVSVERRAAFQAAAATICPEAEKESDTLKVVEAAAARMAARLAKYKLTFLSAGSWDIPVARIGRSFNPSAR